MNWIPLSGWLVVGLVANGFSNESYPPLPKKQESVRTTAYTHTEADHLKHGKKTAAGTTLRNDRTYTSAAADWSKYPLGTKFKIEGMDTTFVVDDYGRALVGTDTIDLYHPSKSSMNRWGVRHVDIKVIEEGDFQRSREILAQRTSYAHVRKMLASIDSLKVPERRGLFRKPQDKPEAPQAPVAPSPAAPPMTPAAALLLVEAPTRTQPTPTPSKAPAPLPTPPAPAPPLARTPPPVAPEVLDTPPPSEVLISQSVVPVAPMESAVESRLVRPLPPVEVASTDPAPTASASETPETAKVGAPTGLRKRAFRPLVSEIGG